MLTVNSSDSFEIEREAKKYVRERVRLFNIELRMLTSCECYDVMTVDDTYTIFLISELRIDINDELLISAMNIHVNALSHRERILKRVTMNDISRRHHILKRLDRRKSLFLND